MALYDPRLLTRSIWRQIARFARRQMDRAGWKLEEDGVIAQDYRRQLQERSSKGKPARSREDVLRWIKENPDFFKEIEAVSWGLEGKSQHVSGVRELIKQIPLPNSFDDPTTHAIVYMICEEVEKACRELEIPLRAGVAYGSDPSLKVDAARYAVHFTDSSVISLSTGFICFCSHISKMFSLSLIHETNEQHIHVKIDPTLVFKKIGSDPDLKYYWTEVIGAYAFGSGPNLVKHRLVPHPFSITRGQLLWAMERFSVAHEYAHHIVGHGKRDFAAVNPESAGQSEEYEADLLALQLTRYLGAREVPQNLYAMSGAAAVLLLKSLECVRRARQIFITGNDAIQSLGSHPLASDRIAAFDRLDELLPDPEKRDFKYSRDSFSAIIDTVWPRLRLWYIDMHNHGLRPEDSNPEWLPAKLND